PTRERFRILRLIDDWNLDEAKRFYDPHFLESRDGRRWERRNDVNATVDGHRGFFGAAAYDPLDSNPARRYKGLKFSPAQGRLELLESPDGWTWKRAPVPSFVTGDTFHLSVDERARRYVLTLKIARAAGAPRTVALSTSRDARSWTTPRRIFE